MDKGSAGARDPGVTLCLCGDVMTGRGVDQILPHPSPPRLYEPWAHSALDYVALAERASGPIRRPITPQALWGPLLAALDRLRPDARLINLETAVTTSEEAWPGKGIHYRTHPANLACLSALHIDCCTLANNHVLDWGRAGLAETLDSLQRAGIRSAGAGPDLAQAQAPAVIELAGKGRVLVFACATPDSGVPEAWAATRRQSGLHLLPDLSLRRVDALAALIAQARRDGDLVVLSIHWGDNWGFAVSPEQRAFAQALVERAGVDLLHGHSSHHVRGIEVHRGRALLYGCGDLLNDYEGIAGHEAWRGDLSALYLPTLERSGRLRRLALLPTQVRQLRLHLAPPEARAWLRETLNREGRPLGTWVRPGAGRTLALGWETH